MRPAIVLQQAARHRGPGPCDVLQCGSQCPLQNYVTLSETKGLVPRVTRCCAQHDNNDDFEKALPQTGNRAALDKCPSVRYIQDNRCLPIICHLPCALPASAFASRRRREPLNGDDGCVFHPLSMTSANVIHRLPSPRAMSDSAAEVSDRHSVTDGFGHSERTGPVPGCRRGVWISCSSLLASAPVSAAPGLIRLRRPC